ncbi:MAG: hypothetical protein NT015_07880 [Alphaproteobacteria bacterium]|nr:hypothetical protein [Alphaproteobacteria bacterium]
MARPSKHADPATEKNWVFVAVPVLDVDVSIIAAPGHVDLVRGPKRDDAIRVIVERCGAMFAEEISGRVEHVRHSNFNHHGMAVHMVITARESENLDDIVERDLGALERALEANLQSLFGWEQAAVSVQIDPNPAQDVRRGRRAQPRTGHADDINVWQPGGGSNAIAPVIVTVPTAGSGGGGGGGDDDDHRQRSRTVVRQGSNALAGLFGALLAIGVAILIGVVVGPLTEQIGNLYQDRQFVAERHASEIRVRDQEIRSLRGENGRLNNTVQRLASRRGQPAMRSDQPTRALRDTDSLSPLATPPPATAAGEP